MQHFLRSNVLLIFSIVNALLLLLFYYVTSSFALSVVLRWEPNAETDLAGYKVYYGASGTSQFRFNGRDASQGASPVDVSNQVTFTLNGLDSDQDYYFAVTAYNLDGEESGLSNVVFLPKASSTSSSSFTYNDAMLALRAAVGKVILTSEEKARLDVAPVANGVSVPNGKIDAGDAIVILSRIITKPRI